MPEEKLIKNDIRVNWLAGGIDESVKNGCHLTAYSAVAATAAKVGGGFDGQCWANITYLIAL